MKKKYTPVIWLDKRRMEFHKSYPTKKEALKVSEQQVRKLMKLPLNERLRMTKGAKYITSGYNVR